MKVVWLTCNYKALFYFQINAFEKTKINIYMNTGVPTPELLSIDHDRWMGVHQHRHFGRLIVRWLPRSLTILLIYILNKPNLMVTFIIEFSVLTLVWCNLSTSSLSLLQKSHISYSSLSGRKYFNLGLPLFFPTSPSNISLSNPSLFQLVFYHLSSSLLRIFSLYSLFSNPIEILHL